MSFAGTTCRLKEARGLHYIAHLLQQPHQEVHVITLITMSADLNEGLAKGHSLQDASLSFDHTEGFSDAGEILDPQARAAYKQRVSELQEELAEAQNFTIWAGASSWPPSSIFSPTNWPVQLVWAGGRDGWDRRRNGHG